MGGSRIVQWFRRWGVAAVVVAAILSAFGIGGVIYADAERLRRAYEHQAAENAQKYADRARIVAQTRCVPLPPQEERECVREEAQAARQGQRDEYDLQAQLVTSAWTRAMGIAALVAMAFGILGVGLVFITFRETRHANRIARESLEGQLRPWIDFKLLENGTLEIVNDNLELTATATFENIGESPAIDLTYLATMVFGEDVNPHFNQLIKGFGTDVFDWADKNLFHGEEWTRQACAIHFGERKGPVKITYVLVARYRTPFSRAYKFTGKAYDVQILSRDRFGGYQPQGALIDISKVVSEEIVKLVEKQQFAGFAT